MHMTNSLASRLTTTLSAGVDGCETCPAQATHRVHLDVVLGPFEVQRWEQVYCGACLGLATQDALDGEVIEVEEL